MPTLRSYLTGTDYSDITGDTTPIDDRLLDQAETLIDNACAVFYGSVLAKCVDYTEAFETVTVTDTTATLPNSNNNIDYWKYCTIEILSGLLAGRRSLITGSTSNVLTFNSITGLSGTVAIKLYQTGKFPMIKDVVIVSNKCYKSIVWEIKQATAWQVKFMSENPDLFDSNLLQSESIGGNYSYTRGSNTDKKSNITYLAPQTLQLLKPYLLQTI